MHGIHFNELEIIPFIRKVKLNLETIKYIDILAVANRQTSMEYQELLNKILASIHKINNKLSYELFLINSMDDIANLNFKKIIIFGDISSLNQTNSLNKANILLADHIIDISKDNNKKRELWQQLQTFCR